MILLFTFFFSNNTVRPRTNPGPLRVSPYPAHAQKDYQQLSPGPARSKESPGPTQPSVKPIVVTRPGPWAMGWAGLGPKARPMQGPRGYRVQKGTAQVVIVQNSLILGTGSSETQKWGNMCAGGCSWVFLHITTSNWWWWWYHSLTAHQHQKGHTVPKQVIMIATSIQHVQVATV